MRPRASCVPWPPFPLLGVITVMIFVWEGGYARRALFATCLESCRWKAPSPVYTDANALS